MNDYIKLEYNKTGKLCHMDTDSFIVHVETEDIYEDIIKNYELERLLPKKNRHN